MTDINGNVFVRVDVFGQRGRFTVEGVFIPVATTVTMKLNVSVVIDRLLIGILIPQILIWQ